jgi:NitT/TauT family transport system ATP-binding protein
MFIMPAGLSAQDLTIAYNAPDGGTLAALGPVSFEIAPGQFVCLIGPSGCGKSTLIRVFAGLLEPTTGIARINGETISEPSRRVGLMFQQANLMPWRTVIDNIALPLELAGIPKTERHQAARNMLNLLNLEGFDEALPGELSGGMAQRAALGRTLIQQPDVLLLDEPFGALDAMTREKISADMLKVWQEQRQTALMVTHDIQEAVLLSDRILVMSQRPGQIVADIAVDLPRPRHIDQTYDAAFGDLARQARMAIEANG